MRAVSAGMGPMAWGYIVMLLLLLSARRFRFPVSYHFYFYFHSPAESFRVARGVGRWSCFRKISVRGTGTRATLKALPSAPHRSRPYGDRPGHHSQAPNIENKRYGILKCLGRRIPPEVDK